MLPISSFIIACNEADRISKAINSLKKIAEEVVVVDSGSVDDTVKIATNLGAKVVYNKWPGYGQQKVYAETLCKHDWILNLDADEELSEELIEEIKQRWQEINSNPRIGHQVHFSFVSVFSSSKPITLGGITAIRLYHRKYAGFREHSVYDSVVSKTSAPLRVSKFRNSALHYSVRSVSHAVKKYNEYTDAQLEVLLAAGKKFPLWRIAVDPWLSFLKAYFLKGYWKYGMVGYSEAWLYAVMRTVRTLKFFEMKK